MLSFIIVVQIQTIMFSIILDGFVQFNLNDQMDIQFIKRAK